MFKNSAEKKKKIELKDDDASGDCRKVYNEKVKNLNSSPNIQITECR